MALSACLAGCSAEVASSPQGEDSATVHGFLSVDRTSPWNQETEGAEEVASATFLKLHDSTDPAVVARLVGVIPELPPQGTCRTQSTLDPSPPNSVPLRMLSPVELVQAGEVSVRSDTSATRLVARAYPDVAHLVSGVVYTSSGREQPVAAGRVVFEIGGADTIGRFDVDVPMPGPIDRVVLNGVEVGDDEPVVASGDALTLVWQAAGEDLDLPAETGRVVGSDLFYVDLSVGRGEGARKVRCSGSSQASLRVPLAPRAGTTITVSAHRLRTIRLGTPALSGGELRLDTARSAVVRLAEAGEAAAP